MRWIKASERLPEKTGCYFVRWEYDPGAYIMGACMWEFFPGEKFFDVSDDDDEDRLNPRGAQPHEWLDETAESPLEQQYRELVEAQGMYISFLKGQYDEVFSNAYVHGYRTDEKFIRQGEVLREQISIAQQALKQNP